MITFNQFLKEHFDPITLDSLIEGVRRNPDSKDEKAVLADYVEENLPEMKELLQRLKREYGFGPILKEKNGLVGFYCTIYRRNFFDEIYNKKYDGFVIPHLHPLSHWLIAFSDEVLFKSIEEIKNYLLKKFEGHISILHDKDKKILPIANITFFNPLYGDDVANQSPTTQETVYAVEFNENALYEDHTSPEFYIHNYGNIKFLGNTIRTEMP